MVNERGSEQMFAGPMVMDDNMRLEERLYLAFQSLIFQKQGLRTS